MELESFTFVLIRRGPRAADYDDAELEELQAAHLAHLDSLRDRGHLVLAGPFSDQKDETKRGLGIFRTSLEETKRLMAEDPSVRAGRISIEAMTWLTLRGSLG
jgi:uncharacterized protein